MSPDPQSLFQHLVFRISPLWNTHNPVVFHTAHWQTHAGWAPSLHVKGSKDCFPILLSFYINCLSPNNHVQTKLLPVQRCLLIALMLTQVQVILTPLWGTPTLQSWMTVLQMKTHLISEFTIWWAAESCLCFGEFVGGSRVTDALILLD